MAGPWYVDYVNGLDINAGTSWAAAFKTLQGATSAKGVVAGDEVRVAKSPDPTSLGQTATWTDRNRTVTLTSPVTANIDRCDAAWSVANSATQSVTAVNYKEGSGAVVIVVPASAANTLYAYHALGSTVDFSAYQMISFWISFSVTLAANTNFRICLCSDAAGTVIVNSAPVPAGSTAGRFMPITVDFGAALGSSIQSVALYSGSTTMGAVTLTIDNILACKASSAPDSLTLGSLISKNTGDGWYPIQAINGTAITIDNSSSGNTGTSGRGYSGTTETVTTYKRETIKTALAASLTTPVQSLSVAVTANGGYDPVSGLQNGETFFDGLNGVGWGIGVTVMSTTYNRLSMVRYTLGYQVASGIHFTSISCDTCTAHNTNGITLAGPITGMVLNINSLSNNGVSGLQCTGVQTNASFTLKNVNNNANAGVGLFMMRGYYTGTNCRNNGNGGFSLTAATDTSFSGLTLSNNQNGDIIGPSVGYSAYFRGCTIVGSNGFTTTAYNDARLFSHNNNGVVGSHRISTDGGLITNDTTTVHTVGGTSWKIAPTSANRAAAYPLWLSLAKVFCPADESRTFSAWFRRDNTAITGQLVIRGGKITGIPNTVTDTMTAAANTWEQRSLTVTPTEDGVIEVEAWAYGGTIYNVWVTEFSVT